MEKCIFFYLSDEHNFLQQRSDEYDAFFYFDQVFDRYCNGISGALVEVWYAGGEPGCGEYFTLNS